MGGDLGQYSIQLVRDRAFLEWRFAQRPDTDYTILAAEGEGARLRGYAVLNSGEMFGLRVGFILDLAAAGNDAASALVRHALQGFREQNVDAAGCLMLPHTWQYRSCGGRGSSWPPRGSSTRSSTSASRSRHRPCPTSW